MHQLNLNVLESTTLVVLTVVYVQQNSQPLKSSPDSTQHSERHYAHCEQGIASECDYISYAKLPGNIALLLSIVLEAVLSRTP